jgi:hypothetical protein
MVEMGMNPGLYGERTALHPSYIPEPNKFIDFFDKNIIYLKIFQEKETFGQPSQLETGSSPRCNACIWAPNHGLRQRLKIIKS